MLKPILRRTKSFDGTSLNGNTWVTESCLSLNEGKWLRLDSRDSSCLPKTWCLETTSRRSCISTKFHASCSNSHLTSHLIRVSVLRSWVTCQEHWISHSKALYIYPNDSRYYVKTGMLCQQLCRFFEAEFCLQNGLRCLTLGDIISAIKLTSLLKQNIYFAIKRSDCGLDETIIMAPCLCCRNLKEASQKLRNVEVFRAKYIWSTSTVSSPADDFVEIDSDYSSKDSETQYEGHLHTILNKF